MIDFSLVFNDVCNWLLLFRCNYYQLHCKLSQNSPFGRGNKDIVLYCNLRLASCYFREKVVVIAVGRVGERWLARTSNIFLPEITYKIILSKAIPYSVLY